jgi:hypothetical protein
MGSRSVSDIVGEWVDSNWESSLIVRCRKSWTVPISELSNEMLATFLRQQIATNEILSEAQRRLVVKFVDESEIYDGELAAAVREARSR